MNPQTKDADTFLFFLHQWEKSVMFESGIEEGVKTPFAEKLIAFAKEIGVEKSCPLIISSAKEQDQNGHVSLHHVALLRHVVGNITLTIPPEKRGCVPYISNEILRWAKEQGYV